MTDPFVTKITQLLDASQIEYRILLHSEPVFTIETAAAQRGVVKEEMVKSILMREKKTDRYCMACLTGESRLVSQSVREFLPGNWKRLSFASRDEITKITGYVQGAVAPLCLPDDVPVVFDPSILACVKVSISSGDPMAGIELDPHDLARLANAHVGIIAEDGH
jgi:Ala-tRNA(Pro) deacylase